MLGWSHARPSKGKQCDASFFNQTHAAESTCSANAGDQAAQEVVHGDVFAEFAALVTRPQWCSHTATTAGF